MQTEICHMRRWLSVCILIKGSFNYKLKPSQYFFWNFILWLSFQFNLAFWAGRIVWSPVSGYCLSRHNGNSDGTPPAFLSHWYRHHFFKFQQWLCIGKFWRFSSALSYQITKTGKTGRSAWPLFWQTCRAKFLRQIERRHLGTSCFRYFILWNLWTRSFRSFNFRRKSHLFRNAEKDWRGSPKFHIHPGT